MSYFIDSSQLERKEIAPGITIRTMWGEKVMISLIEIAPHSVVPNHSHPHEQAGIMVQGEFEMTVGGETRRVRPGDAYVIPGGVEHGLQSAEGWSLALDIFSPPRDEYK
jgi:quercetin dioxygenase-like cupin family protein